MADSPLPTLFINTVTGSRQQQRHPGDNLPQGDGIDSGPLNQADMHGYPGDRQHTDQATDPQYQAERRINSGYAPPCQAHGDQAEVTAANRHDCTNLMERDACRRAAAVEQRN